MRPRTSKTRKIAIKIKKKIFAIPAVAIDMPVKPKAPAMSEITKKSSANLSILSPLPERLDLEKSKRTLTL